MLDYSSGSFTDFILGDEADLAGPGPPLPEPRSPGPAESATLGPVPGMPVPAGPVPAGPGLDEPVPDGSAAVASSSAEASLVTGHDGNGPNGPNTRPMDLSEPVGAPRGVTSTRPMDLPLSSFSPARGPARSQPAQTAEGLPEPWRNAQADVLASLPPYGERGGPPARARPGRRRARALSLTLALVVLAVGGTAGALTLLRHHAAAPQASTPPQRSGAPSS
ncbi:MAG TPA: hypothetical protein VEH31_28995, partial [Streptosporangiaceae bacterium]|nr:hypothetical protein [Streptosporangiaceae bacterium]